MQNRAHHKNSFLWSKALWMWLVGWLYISLGCRNLPLAESLQRGFYAPDGEWRRTSHMPEFLWAHDLGPALQLPPPSHVTSFAGQKPSGPRIPQPASLVRLLGNLCEPDWAGTLPTSLASIGFPLFQSRAAPDAVGLSLPAICWLE